MNRLQLIQRVRSLTRDFSNAIFRQSDITDYLNEGIDRVVQSVPECQGMPYLTLDTDEVKYLPSAYHSLLAFYSASRCYFQDERFYQSGNLMNEFETKLEELKSAILNGLVVIKDVNGNAVASPSTTDYVIDNYFDHTSDVLNDVDDGVDGVS